MSGTLTARVRLLMKCSPITRPAKWFPENTSARTSFVKVGKMPESGWPLVIAMHGGGKAPKALNDSQWRVMQSYYRDHPGDGGYLYLALRAPTDAWNGFYTGYVYPLVARLIRQMLVCESTRTRSFSSAIPTVDTEPLPLAPKWRIALPPFIARRRPRRMANPPLRISSIRPLPS